MERAVSMWNPIKIELFMDMNGNSNFHRDETIIGYANADGSGFKWYSFQKVAKVQPVIDIINEPDASISPPDASVISSILMLPAVSIEILP